HPRTLDVFLRPYDRVPLHRISSFDELPPGGLQLPPDMLRGPAVGRTPMHEDRHRAVAVPHILTGEVLRFLAAVIPAPVLRVDDDLAVLPCVLYGVSQCTVPHPGQLAELPARHGIFPPHQYVVNDGFSHFLCLPFILFTVFRTVKTAILAAFVSVTISAIF